MIADWLEQHPEIELPYDAQCYSYFAATTKEAMVRLARTFGSCEKEYSTGLFSIKKQFGAISFEATCSREQVCERVVTGKREVPAQTITTAAHTEDIVEWRCFD